MWKSKKVKPCDTHFVTHFRETNSNTFDFEELNINGTQSFMNGI